MIAYFIKRKRTTLDNIKGGCVYWLGDNSIWFAPTDDEKDCIRLDTVLDKEGVEEIVKLFVDEIEDEISKKVDNEHFKNIINSIENKIDDIIKRIDVIEPFDSTEIELKIDNIEKKVNEIESFDSTELELKIDNIEKKVDEIEPFDSTELELKIDNKQDKLESSINIKTINGESILGNGNIETGHKHTWRKM